MKLAFKATDNNMCCNGFQYEIGIKYSKDETTDLRICSNTGYHFCYKLDDVFKYYNRVGSRLFIVKVDDSNQILDEDKGITKSIEFLFEITNLKLPPSSLTKIIEDYNNYTDIESFTRTFANEIVVYKYIKTKNKDKEEQIKKLEKIYKESLCIDIVKQICKENPTAIVGGSVALFLHGVRLERWLNGSSDIDIILPYYSIIQSEKYSISKREDKSSGSDFSDCYNIKYLNIEKKLEVAISPTSKYEMINYEGFNFKVNTLQETWEYKLKYKNNPKHIEDLKEIIKNGNISHIRQSQFSSSL